MSYRDDLRNRAMSAVMRSDQFGLARHMHPRIVDAILEEFDTEFEKAWCYDDLNDETPPCD